MAEEYIKKEILLDKIKCEEARGGFGNMTQEQVWIAAQINMLMRINKLPTHSFESLKEKEIIQLILEHGEYLPTLCEDSGQPEWCVREVESFAKFLCQHFKKAEGDKVDALISELLSEFANTRLDDRKDGWHWLLKLRERLKIQVLDKEG